MNPEEQMWVRRLLYAYTSELAGRFYSEHLSRDYQGRTFLETLKENDLVKTAPKWAELKNDWKPFSTEPA